MKPSFVTFCVAILFASAASATTPRLFIEATVSPTNPVDAQLFRAGFTSGRLYPFFGYFNWSHDPDVDEPGWHTSGDEYVLAGVHWLTASPQTALFIPCLGGGALIGQMKHDYYTLAYPPSSFEPNPPVLKRPSDVTTALGLFADTGLRIPIRPTKLLLAADLHWSLATTARTSSRSDYYDNAAVESRIAILSLYWLVGATYRF